MDAQEFYSKLVLVLTKEGKGDKPITISIGGVSITIDDIVWHDSCNEFHVLPKEASDEDVERWLDEIDRRAKSRFN